MAVVQEGQPMILPTFTSVRVQEAGQGIKAVELVAVAVEPSYFTATKPVPSLERSALSGKMPTPPRSREVEEAAEAASLPEQLFLL